MGASGRMLHNYKVLVCRRIRNGRVTEIACLVQKSGRGERGIEKRTRGLGRYRNGIRRETRAWDLL